ncbi:hypothetical protein D5S17_12715 [Pseudonocardiaceae bacterium YIM PH 21723]|nr:hypothetical protein D5S17_12715 [Pseudonocardiaceae bacterium YIM PH 21723]
MLAISLIFAVIYCAAFTVIILGSVLLAPDSMVHAYPPAIRAKYGEKSRRGVVATTVASVLHLGTVVVLAVLGLRELRIEQHGDIGFGQPFVFGVLLMLALIVYDLVVLDWVLFCTIRPRFFVLPGTEDMPEYRDYDFHWRTVFPSGALVMLGLGVVLGLANLVFEAIA